MEVQAAQKISSTSHSLIASDRVDGTLVRRLNGEDIATIQRLMIDKLGGKVAYAVLTFGGFLGTGQRRLPMLWARPKYNLAWEAYQLDLTDEKLGLAPSYGSDALLWLGQGIRLGRSAPRGCDSRLLWDAAFTMGRRIIRMSDSSAPATSQRAENSRVQSYIND